MLRYKNTVIALILSIVCMLPLCGCRKTNDADVLYKTPKYTISEENEGYYISLSGDIKPQENTGMMLGTVQFSSIEEMKEKLKSGDFTDGEMNIINNFAKDEQNRIKLCNIDNLYEPVMPSGSSLSRYFLWIF